MSEQRLPAERGEAAPVFDPRAASRLVSRGLARLAAGEGAVSISRHREDESPIWVVRFPHDNGDDLWAVGIAGGLLIVDRCVYRLSFNVYAVRGIDPVTGAVRRSFDTSELGELGSAEIVADDLELVAAITRDGEVIGFTTDRPDPVWRFSPYRHPNAGDLWFASVRSIGNDARSDDGDWFKYFPPRSLGFEWGAAPRG